MNGAFLIDPSIINDSAVVFNNYKDNTLFVKNGIVELSPTQKLIDGSASCLSLLENHSIDFNTSIIEHSTDNAILLNVANETKNVLANLEWNKIGSDYNFDLLGQTKIKDSFLDISINYLDLYSDAQRGGALSFLPNNLIELTPKEYLNEAYLLRSTYDLKRAEDKEIISKELSANEILLCHLSNLNPDLKNLYLGALEALNSNNADRIRHYSSSLRELFTHTLHLLSPDEKIKKWSNDPGFFYNKKPTRKARILYIVRKINSEKFKKFINSDIKSNLEFIDLFQEGTHKIKPSYSEAQLSIMKTRMESTLIYLIESSLVN